MKWDIFSNRKKERRHHRKDEIDEMIVLAHFRHFFAFKDKT